MFDLTLSLRIKFEVGAGIGVDLNKSTDEIYEIEKLGDKIYKSSNSIERCIVEIISNYFMPKNKSRFELFCSTLTESDNLSYFSKVKILRAIVEYEKIFLPKEIDETIKVFRKVGSYRNAFIHGKVTSNGGSFQIEYYEGEKQIKELNQEYFDKVSEYFDIAWNKTYDIAESLKIYKNLQPFMIINI